MMRAARLHPRAIPKLSSAAVMIDAMAISMLDRAIYSYADVDRLVGLHGGTARRWLDGYTRAGKFYEPILREASMGTEVVTWGEMVEARLLAEFRSRDVTVQKLRPAIEQLRERFGRYPLALAQPFL
jgi:predicted transcriptional regulator